MTDRVVTNEHQSLLMKDTAEDENPTMTGDIICGNQCDSIETDNTAIFADHTATVFQLGVNADVDEAFSAGIELAQNITIVYVGMLTMTF